MNRIRFHREMTGFSALLVCLLVLSSMQAQEARAQGAYDPTAQTPTLLYKEAETVYLGNLARRNNGVPPLRWNLQLTHAARWYSWDSTENRPSGFCGHQDTLGRWPSERALFFVYLGSAGAENSYCGYLAPQDAINGWMNSPGHRANLLDPNSREIGLGYYRRNSDGRGYVTQDFGNDPVYAPIIIENEALTTTSPDVNLYIYDRSSGGGFAGFSAATEMMVSNRSNFSGATWEPYSANKTWTLLSGTGWRDVYVKTRDVFDRNMVAKDSIYLGDTIALNELDASQMSTTESQVTLYNLDGGSLPQVQFSLGWMADDTDESFVKWWGNGERVVDASAWGGTAYRLYPGDGESFAWDGDWKFPITNVPLVAYFRLKVNSNVSSSEVARISVQGGMTEYAPLSLLGTDFNMSNQYQEFALPFTFSPNSEDPFLFFKFWRSGTADVYIDAVSIFSTPQAVTSPLTWVVPGNNYRGQGIWIRYTDGSQFSEMSEATVAMDYYPLSVQKSGSGSGTISSNPPGIDCGSDCSEDYPTDTPVELSASPDSGSIFAGWSGDADCSDGIVSMNASKTCIATFNTPTYILTVTRAGNGTGTVTSSPSGISCGLECSYGFGPATQVTLTATADPGSSFAGWSGACTGPDPSCMVSMNAAQSVTANFTLQVGSFSKSNPPMGSTQPVTTTLSWEPVDGATSYEFCYDKINDNACAWRSNGTSTSKTLTALTRGATYYWHIRARIGGMIVYSDDAPTAFWSFIVARLPLAPILVSPPTNLASSNTTPAFDWNPVLDGATYEIQIDSQSTFAAPLVQSHVGNETDYTATSLPDGIYFWRVRAFNVIGEAGRWSRNRKIVVDTTAPLPPTLNLPANNAAMRSTPAFSWRGSATAKYYQFAYDDTNDCSSPLYQSVTITTRSHRPPSMPLGTFSWCVKAADIAGNWSGWGLSRTVMIYPPIPLRPALVSPINGVVITDTTPTLLWNAVAGGNTYELQIATNTTFTQNLQTIVTGVGQVSVTLDPLNPGRYYWRVRAVNVNMEAGAWSGYRAFTVSSP